MDNQTILHLLLHQRLAAVSQAFVAALGMARIEAIRLDAEGKAAGTRPFAAA